jgi:hypothetical protein
MLKSYATNVRNNLGDSHFCCKFADCAKKRKNAPGGHSGRGLTEIKNKKIQKNNGKKQSKGNAAGAGRHDRQRR